MDLIEIVGFSHMGFDPFRRTSILLGQCRDGFLIRIVLGFCTGPVFMVPSGIIKRQGTGFIGFDT